MTNNRYLIYWLGRLVVVGAIATLASCSGTAAERVPLNQPAVVPFADLLPPIPQIAGGGRHASTPQNNIVNGMDSFSQSGGAMVDGTGMDLPSTAGGIQWTIYRYMAGDATPVSIFVDYTAHTGYFYFDRNGGFLARCLGDRWAICQWRCEAAEQQQPVTRQRLFLSSRHL